MGNRTTAYVLALSFSVPLATPGIAHAADDAPPPPSPSAADDAPRRAAFGSRGVLAIGSDANASITETFRQGGVHETSLNVQPSVDYFVADHLSVGVALWVADGWDGDPAGDHSQNFIYGAGPRVGYDIPLSEHFSLWPKASIFFEHATYDNTNVSLHYSSSTSSVFVEPELFVPVLYHPVPHFFVGFGPYAETVFASAGIETSGPSFGAKFTLGGWVGI